VQTDEKASGPAGVDKRVGAGEGGDDIFQLVLRIWGLGRRILAWERGGEGGGRQEREESGCDVHSSREPRAILYYKCFEGRGSLFRLVVISCAVSSYLYRALRIRTITVSTGSRACFDMNPGPGSIALYHAGSQSGTPPRLDLCRICVVPRNFLTRRRHISEVAPGAMDGAYGAICRKAVCGPLWRRRRRTLSMRMIELWGYIVPQLCGCMPPGCL
jgi:hypothetical protein